MKQLHVLVKDKNTLVLLEDGTWTPIFRNGDFAI